MLTLVRTTDRSPAKRRLRAAIRRLTGRLGAASGAGLALSGAAPALAHPGPHDDLSAAGLAAHLFSDGFHVAHIAAPVALVLMGLGVWRIVRAARQGFRE